MDVRDYSRGAIVSNISTERGTVPFAVNRRTDIIRINAVLLRGKFSRNSN